MFAPTKVWRRWHRKVSVNQRRFAIASALAASALPSLVMARGHRVSEVAELPLIVAPEIESIEKTSVALKVLANLKAIADVDRVRDSRKIRAGKGKARNRRYRERRGPLVIYKNDSGIVKAFRNIPGVDLLNVSALNLLQLAPGGHLGRFVIWTQPAFEELEALYGNGSEAAALKSNYFLPTAVISNPDISRIINSAEVQSVLKAAGPKQTAPATLKSNPLRNAELMKRLNPYAEHARQVEAKKQKQTKTIGQASKAFVDSLRHE